jgi:presenilin-like A22 family membrane protease
LLLGIAGVSANMGGSLSPVAACVILAILSVYDIAAVYLTKHMVEMGESLLRQRVFFAIIVPRGISGFQSPLREVAPGSGHYFIGTGDLVLPALLISSATYFRLETGITAAIGALLGLAATTALFLSQKLRRAMPALPPIALGAIIGYLIGAAVFP